MATETIDTYAATTSASATYDPAKETLKVYSAGDPGRPLWPKDVVDHRDGRRMTVVSIQSVGGEEAYECRWLDEVDECIRLTWHRRSELKAI